MRFKVTSIGGWTISQASHGGTGPKQSPAVWYVLDSANSHHIVREFRRIPANYYARAAPEREAREFAAQLERDYP